MNDFVVDACASGGLTDFDYTTEVLSRALLDVDDE